MSLFTLKVYLYRTPNFKHVRSLNPGLCCDFWLELFFHKYIRNTQKRSSETFCWKEEEGNTHAARQEVRRRHLWSLTWPLTGRCWTVTVSLCRGSILQNSHCSNQFVITGQWGWSTVSKVLKRLKRKPIPKSFVLSVTNTNINQQ